ncbi:PAC2 family protein [Arsenicicoccus sp. oral taxon 190]|uniref:PAC2 family protein n=1 Tax=Arsenicicoccus sp. oral taxon 190 TaxID=1658671 RepID=UPI000679F0D9|nr:PAC2 family protein [Arsenicicoccus sp. oral taxon 190]AKT51924.1 carboxylate--amine ligase [Arsenicicoccus sp. oral taxon 190]
MIQFDDLPELRRPVMIAAFEGWNDAGEAATDLVAHLATAWGAEAVAAIDPEEYYDFQVTRPRIVHEGGERIVTWPTTRILHASLTGEDRDVLLVQGIEPSVRWRGFTEELLDFAEQAGVELVITLGAYLAPTPHTRPIATDVTSESEELTHRFDIAASTYEGPTGIVGVLGLAAEQIGLPTVSAWAGIPHYAGSSPSPKASLALLDRVEELLGITIPRGDFPEDAIAWQHGVDELASGDDDVAEYISSLEEAQDTAELPEATGEAIAREFEKFLRRRDDDPK